MNYFNHETCAIFNCVLTGKMAVIIKKTINAEVPYVPWITGYIAILVGAFMTFIVQSSSIFTSTLTPLIGVLLALNLITEPFMTTRQQTSL